MTSRFAMRLPSPPVIVRRCTEADALVISGGGLKGLAALGAVHVLKKRGELRGVKTMVGTSAGALVCAALACGRNPMDVMRVVAQTSVKPEFDLARLGTSFGIDTGRGVTDLIDAVLGKRYTFADVFHQHGVKLVVCVTNVTERKPEYLGPDTHPDMDIALALRMSCSVPLYFAAVKIQDAVYVDGVLTDNFPCEWPLTHGKCRQVLGIKFTTNRGPVTGIDSYISALVQCALWRHAPRARIPGVRLMELDVPPTSNVNFTVRPNEARKLFKTGADQTRTWLKKTV